MSEGPSAEMPRYRSHKEVWALKIAAICPAQSDPLAAFLSVVEPGYGQIFVDAEYMRKHDPKVGGYYVVYQDGYKSWSPAKAFEDGYTRM